MVVMCDGDDVRLFLSLFTVILPSPSTVISPHRPHPPHLPYPFLYTNPHIAPHPQAKSKLTMITQLDPGGFAPPVIVNHICTLGPIGFLKNVEAAARRKRPVRMLRWRKPQQSSS